MQAQIQKINTLLTEFENGDNWTGINATQTLSDISAIKAVKRINEHHLNIAELTAHISCWNKVIAKRLNAENYRPAREEDFPVINKLTTAQWNKLKQEFFLSFEILEEQLQQKEDADLPKPIFKGASSAYRNLHGQIAHIHYHLGQIVLLKKLLA